MTARVHLLTFDHLPNRQLVGDTSPVALSFETLDAESAFFESHYLQCQGVDSLLNAESEWQSVGQTLSDLKLSGTFHSQPDSERSELTGELVSRLPGFLTLISSREQHGAFAWSHVNLSPGDEESIAKQFSDRVAEARSGMADQCDAPGLLIVTCLTGCDSPEKSRFDFPVFEGKIRVPMWLLSATGTASRIQSVTGSFDIACTIDCVLNDRKAGAAQLVSPGRPVNVASLPANPGLHLPRQLAIQTKELRAIRTRDFLYAEPKQKTSADADESDSSAFLYSKPEDCWNAHNVAAEYLELVAEFGTKVSQVFSVNG